MSILGTRVIRTEDPRLLTAGGVYVDDLRTPELNGAARVTFVRSPVAHARITGIDASEALTEPGVIAVLTVADMDDLAPPPPSSGEWDGRPAVWVSSQNAQVSRFILAGALGMAPDQLRVVVPDVGGGFGGKIGIDRDTITLAWAARKTGRALRWAETRSENLVAMTQGRSQLQHIRIGGSRDGRILAYRIDVIQDIGAYPRIGGLLPFLTCLMAPGVYDIPDVQAGFRQAVTNMTPIAAYRGAGRPEATAAIERAVDLFAAEIGMDPAEVRRRNLVPADKFPYTTLTGAVYDCGEYVAALDQVVTAGGYAELRAEQARRRERGDTRQRGLGLASYVEITAGDFQGGETARVAVDGTGSATVYTGSSPHGQGHYTAFAMLAS